MRGLRCRNCDGRRDVQAYITAYDIAKKHGYTGTEAEWIASIGTVFVAKVVTQTPGAWTCDTTYEYLVAQKTAGKIIALAAEDTIAWLVESEDDLIFATLPFDDATYREYVLDDEDTGTWTTRASGSVFSDYIPASVQPTKQAGMTRMVGLDENQQLWAEGQQKYTTTITYSDPGGYTSDHAFSQVSAAHDAGYELEFIFGKLYCHVDQIESTYIAFHAIDATVVNSEKMYLFVLTSTGVAGSYILLKYPAAESEAF